MQNNEQTEKTILSPKSKQLKVAFAPIDENSSIYEVGPSKKDEGFVVDFKTSNEQPINTNPWPRSPKSSQAGLMFKTFRVEEKQPSSPKNFSSQTSQQNYSGSTPYLVQTKV